MKTIVKTMAALVMAAGGLGFVGCKHSVTPSIPRVAIPEGVLTENVPDCTVNNVVEFGYWPQTLKKNDVTIDTSIIYVANGWDCYKGSDKNYYVKENVKQKNKELLLDDGTTKVGAIGNVGYFKLEPIQWRVLTDISEGKKLLFAEKALEVYNYDDNSNNYKDSQIRAYLNGEFLNKAFSPAQIKKIASTEVDNSANSTIGTGQEKADNQYAGGSTTDKIFLLSLQEITIEEYGFGAYNETQNQEATFSRAKKTTDYTRSKDIWVYNWADKKEGKQRCINYCCYWLRSPVSTDGIGVQMIGEDGRNGHEDAGASFAVVPALVL